MSSVQDCLSFNRDTPPPRVSFNLSGQVATLHPPPLQALTPAHLLTSSPTSLLSSTRTPGLEGARCDACGLEAESADDMLLQCDGPCGRFVHQYCCWELKRPDGAWQCPLCTTGRGTPDGIQRLFVTLHC